MTFNYGRPDLTDDQLNQVINELEHAKNRLKILLHDIRKEELFDVGRQQKFDNDVAEIRAFIIAQTNQIQSWYWKHGNIDRRIMDRRRISDRRSNWENRFGENK